PPFHSVQGHPCYAESQFKDGYTHTDNKNHKKQYDVSLTHGTSKQHVTTSKLTSSNCQLTSNCLGWHLNVEGAYKKTKKEQENKRDKMHQKARDKNILEGDENTRYFHLKAKGKNEGKKSVEAEINGVATFFFRDLQQSSIRRFAEVYKDLYADIFTCPPKDLPMEAVFPEKTALARKLVMGKALASGSMVFGQISLISSFGKESKKVDGLGLQTAAFVAYLNLLIIFFRLKCLTILFLLFLSFVKLYLFCTKIGGYPLLDESGVSGGFYFDVVVGDE
ncbi:hypothetical protein ACJX0J_016048, partial [Zea mays]